MAIYPTFQFPKPLFSPRHHGRGVPVCAHICGRTLGHYVRKFDYEGYWVAGCEEDTWGWCCCVCAGTGWATGDCERAEEEAGSGG